MSQTKNEILNEGTDPLEGQRVAVEELADEFGEDNPDVIAFRHELALAEAAQEEAGRHIQRQKDLSERRRSNESDQPPRTLLPLLQALSVAEFTGGSQYPILRFHVPQEEPESNTVIVGEKKRPYTVVSLVGVDGNDHCRGESLENVDIALDGTIGQIDLITEGGGTAHGDVADYGTEEVELGDETYSVRRLKLDVGGAERVPAYAIFAKDQARGQGPEAERILVLTHRTNEGEHDALSNAMANA